MKTVWLAGKVLLGAATLGYSIYPLVFLAYWLAGWYGAPLYLPLYLFFDVLPLHIYALLGMVLTAIYALHIVNNKAGAAAVRVFSFWGMFSCPFLAMPFYYYLYVWRDRPPEWAKAQPTDTGGGTFRFGTWLSLGAMVGTTLGILVGVFAMLVVPLLEAGIDRVQLFFTLVGAGAFTGLLGGALLALTRRWRRSLP